MKTRAEPHKQPRPFFIRRSPGYPWRVALQQSPLPFTWPANFSYAQSQPMGRLITHHPFCPLAHMPPKNTIPFVHYSVKKVLLDARPRSLILLPRTGCASCSSVGYFIPVSSLRCALSERTIASRAIRLRYFELPSREVLLYTRARPLQVGTVNNGGPCATTYQLHPRRVSPTKISDS